ncbi:uncharacterized protein LOC141858559 [Brevipalpus obovatus]|uniref:uncharacterized protein LOC141858559 n=1 Tax=Brevipalpus obovatus TaxID=246614 RepID=UPI003D9EE0D7
MSEDAEPEAEPEAGPSTSRPKSRPEIEQMKEFSRNIEAKQKALEALQKKKGPRSRPMTEKRTRSEGDTPLDPSEFKMPESLQDCVTKFKEFHAKMIVWIEKQLPEEGKWAVETLSMVPYAIAAIILLRILFV